MELVNCRNTYLLVGMLLIILAEIRNLRGLKRDSSVLGFTGIAVIVLDLLFDLSRFLPVSR